MPQSSSHEPCPPAVPEAVVFNGDSWDWKLVSCKVKVDAKGRVPLVWGFIFLVFLEGEEGAGLMYPISQVLQK